MSQIKKYLLAEVVPKRSQLLPYEILKIWIVGNSAKRSVLIYRIAKGLYEAGYVKLSRYLFRKLQIQYGLHVSPKARIGIGLSLPHPNGIVIGAGVIIGCNVTIYQQVTLGGSRIGDAKNNAYPQIGDNTIIFAGAKLIGNISVGQSCLIGCNAVVNRDVPEFATAVGIPAKVILKSA